MTLCVWGKAGCCLQGRGMQVAAHCPPFQCTPVLLLLQIAVHCEHAPSCLLMLPTGCCPTTSRPTVSAAAAAATAAH